MAHLEEWTLKGATLTHVTAEKEYDVSREFIAKGIKTGRLDYRETSMWGNPCLRLLRSQLEKYISDELGAEHLEAKKAKAELRKINKEITSHKRKLTALQARKIAAEAAIAARRPIAE